MATINGTPGNDTITEARNTAGGPLAGPGADTIFGGAGGADSLGGGAGDDVIFSSVGASTIDGGDGADSLIGNSNNDRLTGGLGDDTIDGGDGNDDIDGSPGADSLRGGLGNDTIFGSSNDTLLGDEGDDNFTASSGVFADGGAGNDRMSALGFFPNTGASTLVGGEGDDTLRGGNYLNLTADGGDGKDRFEISSGPSADSIIGGGGADTVIYDGSGFSLFANLVTGTVTSSFGSVDTLIGIEALSTGPQADTVQGGAGNESLFGWLGADTLLGGEGSDTLGGGSGNDSLDGESGIDVASFSGNRSNYTVAAIGGGAFSVLGPDGSDTVAGVEALHFTDQSLWLAATSAADSIVGTSSGDTISGLDGNDTINGFFGDDRLTGGSGNDFLSGDSGTDTAVFGGNLSEYVFGVTSSGALTLRDNRPESPDGADTLGSIELLAFADGTVTLRSLTGNATDTNDSIVGGAGNDILDGQAGDDTLRGGDGADGLIGSAGNDLLAGDVGNDTLNGGDGADFLMGGNGNDSLLGGGGFDVASWLYAPGSVSVTLGYNGTSYSSTVAGAEGQDTVASVEEIHGSAFDDVLTINDRMPGFLTIVEGRGGADTITGPSSLSNSVVASYRTDAGPVLVDLAAGTAQHLGAVDRLSNIIHVHGTSSGDTLLGSDRNEHLVGGPGNDSLDGRGGTSDWVNYGVFTGVGSSGVTVNLAAGIASDGAGGTDSLAGFENIVGSIRNDTLIGNDLSNIFLPMAGADSIDGGIGFDRVAFDGWWWAGSGPTGAVTVNLETGTATGAYGSTLQLASIERATGTFFSDSFLGDSKSNRFNGRGGNDTLNGGPGGDVAEYFNASAGVVVNLTTGTASDGEGGTDSLISMNSASGSNFADTLTGRVDGERSVSLLSGGTGDDLIMAPVTAAELQAAGAFVGVWLFPTAAATVDLELGTVSAPGQGTDVLVNINAALVFGAFGHSVFGTALDNWFETGEGADTIDGRGGFDTVELAEDLATGRTGVTVSLATGIATDSWGSVDRLISIEGIRGFYGADSLVGSSGDDWFGPAAGADTVDGGAGIDTLIYDYGVLITIGRGAQTAVAQGVQIDLQAGTAIDPAGFTDLVIGFENAIGGSPADTILGSTENNRLEGAGGADLLDGRAGLDTLLGGAGNDSLMGAAGDDLLNGGAGNDSVDGGEGVDTAVFSGARAQYQVTPLASGLWQVQDLRPGAPDGADTLSGIELLQFADTVIATGGPTEGDDTLEGTAAGDTIDALGGNDLVAGLAGADRLLGGSGNNTLDGGGENDTLSGGAGADSLLGGTGADSMLGGAGNDSYIVDDAADRLAEARDSGIDRVFSSITWTLGAHLEDLVLTGDAAIDGTGNNLANVLTGNGAANVLNGGGRADTLIGGSGNDLYLIDATDVLIEQAGGGNDTVVANATFALPDHIEVLRFNGTANVRGDGNAENNFILGNVGNNRLLGYDGNDTLNGGAGNDTLQGGEGADSLVGGDGVDRLDGGNGDDTYVLVDADVVIELANAGIDTVLSNISYALPNAVENLSLLGSTDITATGNALANVLNGNSGANLLRGLGEADRISGGGGADTIEGGVGADTLTGGGGADRFLWLTPAEGGDTVTDFVAGSEKLAFANAAFGALGVGALNPANFANDAPNGALGQFVYTKATGVLAWDADGTGGIVAVTIATLSNKPTLAATDFEIVA
ncbi:hypothetical protein DFH01_23665 [Falsiroseomonas bella]|uniref:Calcium-binding protein n=1 Tax=Falsiroseomonas bella TaxID=2184016 RepID=A0A317F695_9PROT|nr:calcium-binding protein [Falsiroseomonas bella]PWS34544.1 hypothetical protein DFH01_23665 [Falsiroseomonas bella]